MGVISGFMMLILGGVLIIIGWLVVYKVNESIGTSTTVGEDLMTKIANGFKIGGTGLTVVGAAVILRTLFGIGAKR